MADPRPWECPRCKRVLAPHVDVCPCSEGGTSGMPAKVTPFTPPSTSGVYTWPTGGGHITMTGTGWMAANTGAAPAIGPLAVVLDHAA